MCEKSSLHRVLNEIGIKSLTDTTSVAPENCFDSLDDALFDALCEEYGVGLRIINDMPAKKLSNEAKLEILNRVLELKHQMILDSIKDIDECSVTGYRLEKMPI